MSILLQIKNISAAYQMYTNIGTASQWIVMSYRIKATSKDSTVPTADLPVHCVFLFNSQSQKLQLSLLRSLLRILINFHSQKPKPHLWCLYCCSIFILPFVSVCFSVLFLLIIHISLHLEFIKISLNFLTLFWCFSAIILHNARRKLPTNSSS